jgi:NADH-quinone oxidoreductase subunit M
VKLFFAFDSTLPGVTDFRTFQFIEHYPWIKTFNIEYLLGVDGISVPMVLLTALLSFLAVIGSWNIEKQIKGYMALFLLLETGMMGVFCALDFFLFYVFWEVMLLPMYFLIGIWGGPRREYAAIKFFLYTLFGSVLMLLVMLALYFNTMNPETGAHTFNMLHYMNQGTHNAWLKGFDIRALLYIGLFIGFAIKVPIFPFHTWLPDAHVEAPTADLLPHIPRCDQVVRRTPCRSRGDKHHLRGAVRHGPERPEEARGILVDQPHGLRPARHGRHDPG